MYTSFVRIFIAYLCCLAACGITARLSLVNFPADVCHGLSCWHSATLWLGRWPSPSWHGISGLRCKQRCCWRFKSSERWRHILGRAVRDFSRDCNVFIFKVKQSKYGDCDTEGLLRSVHVQPAVHMTLLTYGLQSVPYGYVWVFTYTESCRILKSPVSNFSSLDK